MPAVGAVIVSDRRLLLVRRGRAPSLGLWSVPGGKVEAGESEADAVRREVAEETGLTIRVGARLGQILVGGDEGPSFAVADYACTVVGGELRAGDDADAARWIPLDQVAAIALVPGLLRELRRWGIVSPALAPGDARTSRLPE